MTGTVNLNGANCSVYPVPNDGQFNVKITSESRETFSFSIYSELGVKLYEETGIEVSGTFSKQVDLRPIPAGIYTIVFKNETGQLVKKILIK
jgi:hypothetical protein